MKYRMPGYYKKFECIADKCPMTCCEGWAIVVDNESLDKYKKDEQHCDYIMSHINNEEKVFLQEETRCSFLNCNNLCNLYSTAGEDYLCKTCKRYPRHFENYGNLIEAALSMSCPVAAELILSKNNKNRYLIRERSDIVKKDKDVDEYLLSILLLVRKKIFARMKSKVSFKRKMEDILIFGEMLQKKLFQYEKLGVRRKISYYRNKTLGAIKDYCNDFPKGIVNIKSNKGDRQSTMNDYIDMLMGLENINDNWPTCMKQIKTTLYDSCSLDEYEEVCKEFEEYMSDRYEEYEKIFQYFIYTYLLGSVYDYNLQAMLKFSLLCTLVIREWGMSRWLDNNKVFSKEDNVEICYLFSRQIEHSDNNLLALEGILSAHPKFSYDKMLEVV